MGYNLAEHMTYKKILLGAIPSIFMMICLSIYSVVDGFFISNFAGKTPFASVNLIWPFIMTLASLGFMMGTGGTALVAKAFGEGDYERGNRYFSNCVNVSFLIGVASTLLSVFFLPNIARFLGADEEMLPYCVKYGQVLSLGIPFFNLQNLFQSFFTAAEKPSLGFFVTILAGVANIALDAILVAGFGLGVIGAGIGTISGQIVGAVLPLFYFVRKNKSPLCLRPARFEWPAIGRMMSNGVSEFVTNISASVLSMVMNYLLMRYYGQNGVGAYGIICYVWMIYAACFIGYNISVSPRISFHYGAKNKPEMRNTYLKSLVILILFGLFQCGMAEALTYPIGLAFVGYDAELLELTVYASRIYSILYVFLGLNMFGSAFFTALNNGLVSAILSVSRLLVIEMGCVLLFPVFLQGNGVWVGVVAAESVAACMNLLTMHLFGRRYGYRKENGAKEEAREEETSSSQ